MDILTAFQKRLLRRIGQSEIGGSFYLTGGTALSAFYLQHRYSEDLDFFTPDPTAVSQVPAVLQEISNIENSKVTFTRTFDTFLECFLESKEGEVIKMDFAQDTPYRLLPTIRNTTYGIDVDNEIDISTNKLSALFDRAEPKDFVDVYFVCHEVMPFEDLVIQTRQKHLGIDDYWLAVALERVNQVTFLPRMVKSLELAKMKDFFLVKATEIIENINPET